MASDLQVMRRVIRQAVVEGALPEEATSTLQIHTEGPTLSVRDPLKEAQANAIKHEHGVLSTQSWQLQAGLNPDRESEKMWEEWGHIE